MDNLNTERMLQRKNTERYCFNQIPSFKFNYWNLQSLSQQPLHQVWWYSRSLLLPWWHSAPEQGLFHLILHAVNNRAQLIYYFLDGLQSIPRESNNKIYVAAMLLELTIEANEESFLVVLQHGGNNVTVYTTPN